MTLSIEEATAACDEWEVGVPASLDDAVAMLEQVRALKRRVADVEVAIQQDAAQRMEHHKETLTTGRLVIRHRAQKRRNWDHDSLLRAVVASREANPGTGEVEGTLDVLKAVYGLKGYNASITALKARSIDPDEYAETEQGNWTLEVK